MKWQLLPRAGIWHKGRYREREKTLFVFIFPDKDISNVVTLLFVEGQGFIIEFKRGISFPLMCD